MRALLISALFTAACCLSPSADAATRVVTQCGDSGPGSLRATIASALDGDTVDASACYLISITSGQIAIPQDNLQIHGSNGTPYITASMQSRVLRHFGTGTLRLRSLSMSEGRIAAPMVAGGCLYSSGRVELVNVAVGGCHAVSTGGSGYGGAIYARSLSASHSRINTSEVIASDGHGGGIATEGPVSLSFTDVIGNRAFEGGGVFTLGGASITYSTIRANEAGNDGAGLQALGGDVTINKSLFMYNRAVRRCGALCVSGGGRTVMLNSTITSNNARYQAAGELSSNAAISNSTIAFNINESVAQCPGTLQARHLQLESTIIAANICRAYLMTNYDIGGSAANGYTITGSNNLVRLSRVPLPADTITSNPMLQTSLVDNGGPTLTHSLLRGSPALDRGNNKANQQYDQRGPGFPRVLNGRADIGAFESTCTCAD